MMDFLSIGGALVAILCAIVGDALTFSQTKYLLLRVFFDECTHASIGGLVWLGMSAEKTIRERLLGFYIAFVLSAAIDIDHFIAAGALDLKAATNLASRPFLHCSSFWIILNLSLLTYAPSRKAGLPELCLAIWLPHHARDGNRHGLWLWPFGSTPPLPIPLYLAFIPLTVLIGKLFSLAAPQKLVLYAPVNQL